MSSSTLQSDGHAHPDIHPHSHSHCHGHSHGHDHGHGQDTWSGEEYLARPGVKETAIISHSSVIHSLLGAGLTVTQLKKMNVLEIGCGGGAVTPHFAESFASVHALDTSPSMLLAFSSWLSSIPNITHAMHFLSPSSPAEFSALSPMFSPTPEYAERKLPPPRSRFDVAIANLVVHHVDDLDGFMRGVVGSLAEGGWVVFTEFGKVEGGVDMASQHREEMQKATTNEHGSVNGPGHFRAAFTPESISALLQNRGLVDVFAEIRGTLPVFMPEPPCLIVRGRKPGGSGVRDTAEKSESRI